MKAAVRDRYGGPEVVTIRDVPGPEVGPLQVLVRVRAVSLNASDREFLVGSPAYVRAWGLFRPRVQILGSDVAGEVVRVGSGVTRFAPGDAVFGDIMAVFGGLAEYVSVPESLLMKIPSGMSFDVAAALPQASIVALQGLREGCRVGEGTRLLINGAGGGTGSYAIQMAKALGAQVTAVDLGSKGDFMRSLGADEVIDYQVRDFCDEGPRFDAILDLIASRPLHRVARALSAGGRYFLAGGSVACLLSAAAWGPVLSLLTGKKLGLLVVKPNLIDLDLVAERALSGTLRPSIERTFPFFAVGEALSYLVEGKGRGKIVVRF